jgi:Arc/MetJ-type ribon-helix-helix transcriptional regulator
VMVRVDEETSRALDSWVETGSLKSRSEAAALFIKEGLRMHQREFHQLEDVLRDVNQARERLREKAKEIFGPASSGGESASSASAPPRSRRRAKAKEKK